MPAFQSPVAKTSAHQSQSLQPQNDPSANDLREHRPWGEFEPLERLGADLCIVWDADELGNWQDSETFGSPNPLTHTASSRLAEDAARQGKALRTILAAPTQSYLIACPSRANSSQVVTAVVPIDEAESNGERLRIIEQTLQQLVELIGQRPGNDDSSADTKACSWKELRAMIKQRVKSDLSQCGAKWKLTFAVATTLSCLALIPLPYGVRCSVVCEPSLRRIVSSPLDSTVNAVHVLPGQLVKSGQVLCELDGDEFRNELAALRASRDQFQQKLLGALAAGDHSEAAVNQLEIEYSQRKIEIIEKRLRDLEVRSPIDGVVVRGDMERAIGAAVKLGDELFEVAELNTMVAEIAIPESEVLRIENDMPATIQWESGQGTTTGATVKQIHLRSEIKDDQVVFIAEAELNSPDGQLLPGMSGHARIWTGNRCLGWILFHRPFESFRQTLGW